MSKQAESTKSGREVIPVELVGQNAAYVVLSEPYEPAYPNGSEARYSDDYIKRLNDAYPLEDVLGEDIENISQGRAFWRFSCGTPLKNEYGEKVLSYMLINSAQAGSWQPFIINFSKLTDTSIKTARKYLEEVDKMCLSYGPGNHKSNILFGISAARKGRYAIPTEHDNKVIVLPSQTFLEYAAKRK